ncbi:hypothetical protein BH10ACI1_BH10ACI1_08750 [soil metagenome]
MTMKKLVFLITVFVLCAGNSFAQDLRKRAEESPLECSFYLLEKQEPDDRDDLIKAKLLAAEIYASIGEKTKAVEMLTKVLDEAFEDSYREEEILLSAGKIFERYKLEADANLKKVLKKFIADAE